MSDASNGSTGKIELSIISLEKSVLSIQMKNRSKQSIFVASPSQLLVSPALLLKLYDSSLDTVHEWISSPDTWIDGGFIALQELPSDKSVTFSINLAKPEWATGRAKSLKEGKYTLWVEIDYKKSIGFDPKLTADLIRSERVDVQLSE